MLPIEKVMQLEMLAQQIAIGIFRIRTMALLQESELKYRTLFNQSPDGVLIIEPETARLIDFNDTTCAQLGYSRDEFAKLGVSDFEALKSPEEMKTHTEKVLPCGQDVFETKHRTKDGEIMDVLVTAHTIKLAGKTLFQSVFKDITKLKEIDKMKNEFIANVTHELKTPLVAILGFSEILLKGLDGELTEEQRQHIKWIFNRGEDLQKLVNDLLDISRINECQFEIEKQWCNIRTIGVDTHRKK